MQITYDFVEMKIFGEGLMAYGTATLESDQEDASEFFVSKIVLEDGTRLIGSGAGFMGTPDVLKEHLFKLICDQICDEKTVDGRHAAMEWSDAVTELLSSRLTGHNSAARLEMAYGARLS
jgi:hypothetical protein